MMPKEEIREIHVEGLSQLEPGNLAYKRTLSAVFLAGAAAFGSMYCPQGMLPTISHAFQVRPALADLSIAISTGMLAIGMLPLSALSEQFGRRRIIIYSAIVSTIIGFIVPFSPNIYFLLLSRALQGLALGGVPAVIVAYISEEFSPKVMSRAMGLYIAGTGFGGLVGRIVPASLVGDFSWSIAWLVSSILTAIATLLCWRLMPESKYFTEIKISVSHIGITLLFHLKNLRQILLYIFGFLIMGGYVSYYTILPYHMQGEPFNISSKQYSLMFLVNIFAIAASWWTGTLISTYGRGRVLIGSVIIALLGIVISFGTMLIALIFGSILLTIGLFAGNSTASSWVGHTATEHRAQAASLYMFASYGGNSLVNAFAGVLYQTGGWNVSNAYVAVIFVLSLCVGGCIIIQHRSELRN